MAIICFEKHFYVYMVPPRSRSIIHPIIRPAHNIDGTETHYDSSERCTIRLHGHLTVAMYNICKVQDVPDVATFGKGVAPKCEGPGTSFLALRVAS